MPLGAEPIYVQLCVGVDALIGCVVVVAFGVYFVVVLMRLIRAALAPASVRSVANEPGSGGGYRCACGGALSPIEAMQATDEGVMELRTCTTCKRKHMVQAQAH